MLDVAFVHPPADFEKRTRPFAGVFPAETGTDSWFRHAPIGLSTMAQRLRAAGFSARVLNLSKALSDAAMAGRDLDVEARLRALPARVYGVSLHWAVHTPGALALVEILRRLHPESVIVLGGLTSSFFAEEALALAPGLSGVLRGECESAIVTLARAARAPRFDPAAVANLVWKDSSGEVRRNAFAPPDLTPVDWLDASVFEAGSEPDSLVVPILRGCVEDCTFCGGSRSSYGDWFDRPAPTGIDPDNVLDHLRRGAAQGYPVAFLAGDLRGMGDRRARRLLDQLAAEQLPIEIQNELYFAADRDYLERFAKATRRAGSRISLSPESSDEAVRAQVSSGKSYPNETILETVRMCADLGVRLSLCFFFALPGQTRDSILRDLEFIDKAVALAPETTAFMLEPMLFVDPGSRLFREPEKHGMTIRFDTLARIRDGLRAPFWTEAIGYETRWMPRRAMEETILDAFQGTNRLRFKHDQASLSQHLHVAAAIDGHRRIVGALRDLGRPPTDEDVGALVAAHLSPAHRSDNNLKDYNAHARLAAQGLVPHAALPTTTGLLIERGVPRGDVAASLAHGRVDDALEADGLAPALRATLERLAALTRPALPAPFVVGLASFERAVARAKARKEALLRAALGPAGGAMGLTQPPTPGGYASGLVRGLGAVGASAHALAEAGYQRSVTGAFPAGVAGALSVTVDSWLEVSPDAVIAPLDWPLFDAQRLEPEALLARPGRYAAVLAPAGTMALEGEPADLVRGIAAAARLGKPVRARDLLAAPLTNTMADKARRFLVELARTGAIRIVTAPEN